MATTSPTHIHEEFTGFWSGVRNKLNQLRFNLDVFLFLLVLTIFNIHLLSKTFMEPLVFLPHNLLTGQWWTILCFPFVHLSWYHLLLDAGAFLLLYTGLEEKSPLKKALSMVLCSASSLAFSLLLTPAIFEKGLSGLWGIGHGLMAITAFELMQNKENRNVGLVCLLLVVVKSIYELLTGNVLFHFGLCGSPLSACHLGGVFGGLLCVMISMRKKINTETSSP